MDDNPEKSSMKFELPEIGKEALKYLEELEKDKTEEPEEEVSSPAQPVASADEMARILERQAAKTHEAPPKRQPDKQYKKGDLKDNKEKKKTAPSPGGKKMIIGLTGAYAGGNPAAATGERKKQKKIEYPEDVRELIDFLEESIQQYQQYIENIGRNGLAAVNVGYYRDDIQDILDLLKYRDDVNLRPFWERIVKLDLQLRGKAPYYVREVGYDNFKQYQIINDPPLTRWWWYLNRNVAPPIEKPKFWEIWKKI